MPLQGHSREGTHNNLNHYIDTSVILIACAAILGLLIYEFISLHLFANDLGVQPNTSILDTNM